MLRPALICLFLMLTPTLANAWWNEEWGFKKKITLDLQKLKQESINPPESAFGLIRLHTGNFLSFLELSDKGKDIRVLAGDEKTPLKFYIEKFDATNEMAFIWVKLPKEVLVAPEPSIWLYFGNPEAVDGQDTVGSQDPNQVLSYQFNGKTVKDATANANNPNQSTNTYSEGGLIADAAVFQGTQVVRIPPLPSLVMPSTTGWTIGTWLKTDQQTTDAVVFQRTGTDSGTIALTIKSQALVIESTDASGANQVFTGQGTITPGAWHHVALTATADNLTLYLNGKVAGTFPIKTGEYNGEITLGADLTGGRGFVGMLDQFSIYKVARDANSIMFDVSMQGSSSALFTYGDDETPDSEEGGESYFMSTLDSVTIDGWVIIGILGVMFIISWIVMVVKAIVVSRIHKENMKFEEAFSKLGADDIATLDSAATGDVSQQQEEPNMFSLASDHATFSGSSLYRIYHVGVQEMNKRLKTKNASMPIHQQTLSSGAMAAVKASMDAVVVRELQKLNSQMVLLTIAISGGPFLGLLGTVVGVMITFAAIAVSGEVNVNSIAPGIAAALTATVAGLAVAIPALFGYNYLGSRIKVVSADMQVFVDEFIAKLAEQHT
jgi:biopolymer transport protein ExbB